MERWKIMNYCVKHMRRRAWRIVRIEAWKALEWRQKYLEIMTANENGAARECLASWWGAKVFFMTFAPLYDFPVIKFTSQSLLPLLHRRRSKLLPRATSALITLDTEFSPLMTHSLMPAIVPLALKLLNANINFYHPTAERTRCSSTEAPRA